MLFLEFIILKLRRWWANRRFGRLGTGLPALLAGATGLAVALVLVLAAPSPDDLDHRYSIITDRALAVRDYETVRVACLRRLALAHAPRSKIISQLSQAMDGLGHHEEALGLLNALVPVQGAGYEPARVALARELLGRPGLTAADLRQGELWLAGMLQEDPHSAAAGAMMKSLYGQMRAWEAGKPTALALTPHTPEADELAGWVYFQMRDWRAAKPHLQAEVASRPSVMFMLAEAAKATGDDKGFQHWTEQAETFYGARVEQARQDDPADRVAWVQAVAMAGKYEEALDILQAGRKLSGTNAYQATLAWLDAAWAARLAPEAGVKLGSRHKLAQLQEQLEAMSRLKGEAATISQTALKQLPGGGAGSPELFTSLGMEAWRKGNLESARDYLTRAHHLAPGLPVVANNLALILVAGSSPNPDQALKIIQPVVEKYPEQPNFRDTRGQILVLLGRWEEAVKDLEYAVPRLKNNRASRLALAQAYEQLNRTAESEEQLRLAR